LITLLIRKKQGADKARSLGFDVDALVTGRGVAG